MPKNTTSKIPEPLLKILADGHFHSGEEIAQMLGVSRTAVWKHIRGIEALGLGVSSVKGKGYKLKAPIELLSQSAIDQYLLAETKQAFAAPVLLPSVDSTNSYAKDNLGTKSCGVVLAEKQTSGRGRRGRQWASPFAKNIYMSVVWEFQEPDVSLDGLSLCVGLAVAKALEQDGVNGLVLKWPNDLYCEEAKLAGILIELVGELSGPMRIVIGIGVNVSMEAGEAQEIDQTWTSLASVSNISHSRNRLIAYILNQLCPHLKEFSKGGFGFFLDEWNARDMLAGKQVSVVSGPSKVEGLAKGVAVDGALVIETAEGIKLFRGGEVSVRPVL